MKHILFTASALILMAGVVVAQTGPTHTHQTADGNCIVATGSLTDTAQAPLSFGVDVNCADLQGLNTFATLSGNVITFADGSTIPVPAGSTLVGTILTTSDGNSIDLATLDTDTFMSAVTNPDGSISFTNADGTPGPTIASDMDADPTNELGVIDVTANTYDPDGTGPAPAQALPENSDDQTAAEVTYDNTASGLTATDTQAAIDEVAAQTSSVVDNNDGTFTHTNDQGVPVTVNTLDYADVRAAANSEKGRTVCMDDDGTEFYPPYGYQRRSYCDGSYDLRGFANTTAAPSVTIVNLPFVLTNANFTQLNVQCDIADNTAPAIRMAQGTSDVEVRCWFDPANPNQIQLKRTENGPTADDPGLNTVWYLITGAFPL